MSFNASLQRLVVAPRDREHMTIARTSTGERTFDKSGILYVYDEPPSKQPQSSSAGMSASMYKYRVTTPEDELNNQRRTQQMIETITRRQAAAKKPVLSTKYAPPMFGMSTKQQKIENRTWNKDLEASKLLGDGAIENSADAPLNATIRELRHNSTVNQLQRAAATQQRSQSARQTSQTATRGHGNNSRSHRDHDGHNHSHSHNHSNRIPQQSTSPHPRTINPSHSAQFAGQRNAEATAASVDRGTQQRQHRPPSAPVAGRSRQPSPSMTAIASRTSADDMTLLLKSKYLENIDVVETLYQEKQELEQRLRTMERQLRNSQQPDIEGLVSEQSSVAPSYRSIEGGNDKLSASDAAALFDHMDLEAKEKATIADQPTKTAKQPVGLYGDDSDDDDSDDGGMLRPKRDLYEPAMSHSHPNSRSLARSQSAGHSRNNSAANYASTLTKRGYLSDEEYDDDANSRLRRSTGRFQLSSDLQADIDRYEHKQRLLKQKEEHEKRKSQEFEAQRKEAYLKSIHVPKERQRQLVKEMEDREARLNEQYREKRRLKEDAERRRKELEEAERLMEAQRHRKLQEELYNVSDKYTEKIWERALPTRNNNNTNNSADPKAKDKIGTNNLNKTATTGSVHSVGGGSVTSFSPMCASMEARDREYEARRRHRQEVRKAKEDEAARLRAIDEERKREKLLNTKLPDSGRRLTKSSEIRANLVREKMEQEVDEQRRAKAREERKRKMERETAAVVRTIVEQKQYELRQQAGNFSELRTEAEREALAIAARREYRDNRMKNKQLRDEKLKHRPSLMDRFKMDLAKTNAHIAAVQQVASLVPKSSAYDDLFSGMEKVITSKK